MYRKLLTPLKTKCSQCHKTFLKMNWNQRYCDECRILRVKSQSKRYQLKIALQKKINHKLCEHCFILFIPRGSDALYCGRVCYRRANRIKHLEKRMYTIQAQIMKLRKV